MGDSKDTEYRKHHILVPGSPNGPLEVQMLLYAQLRKLDPIFISLFETETPFPKMPKAMNGCCVPLSGLIRLSKQLSEEKSILSKKRDDFSRLKIYLEAISLWDGRETSLSQELPGLGETLEDAFVRIISHIWSEFNKQAPGIEIAKNSQVVMYKPKHENSLPIFCSKAQDLLDKLSPFPQLFPLGKEVEILIMPYYECSYNNRSRARGSYINSIGHRINASRTETGFSLEDSRAKKTFQEFPATAYAEFLTAIYTAGAYQVSKRDYGLCIVFRVHSSLSQSKPLGPFPSPKELWPDPGMIAPPAKIALLFAAAFINNPIFFNFLLPSLKKYHSIKDSNGYFMIHWLVINNDSSSLALLLKKISTDFQISELTVIEKYNCLAQVEGEHSLIDIALGYNNIDMLAQLLDFGFDARPSLIKAIMLGDLEKFIILYKKIDLNFQCTDGYTPLHSAISSNKNSLAMIELLLAADVNPLIPENNDLLPFQLAVKKGRIEIIKLFLAKSSQQELFTMINHRDITCHTPIINAVFNRDAITLSLLLTSGIKLDLACSLPISDDSSVLGLAKFLDFEEGVSLIEEYLVRQSSLKLESKTSSATSSNRFSMFPTGATSLEKMHLATSGTFNQVSFKYFSKTF